MIRHYLRSVLARLAGSPFTTAANVLTLALGLACFIAACAVSVYWQSGDSHHRHAARIMVIGQYLTFDGQTEVSRVYPGTSHAPARYLAEDFPEIESIARVYTRSSVPVAAGVQKVLLAGAFADPAFLEIFDFDFIVGNQRDALREPGSVVLTRDAAERLFGSTRVLGRTLRVDAETDATVTGVIEAVRQPSFMGATRDAEVRFDMLGHWNLVAGGARRDAREDWVSTQGWTFARLAAGVSVTALNDRLAGFVERRMPASQRQVVNMHLEAFPVGEMTTRSLDFMLFSQSAGGLTAVSLLLGLGLLTLVVASVNYANLATAQATSRAKEIGMRKVVGAGRGAIMTQAWLEALLLTSAALAVAWAIVALAAPVVRESLGVDLLFLFRLDAAPVLLSLALVLLVAAAAGAYPAVVLSRVRPAEALHSGRARGGPRFVTRMLVGIQFGTASFLVIVLTIAQMQRAHLERTSLRPQEDPIVVLNEVQSVGVDYTTLAERLRRQPGIRSVSATDRPPWQQEFSLPPLARSPEESAAQINGILRHVALDYFATVDLDVLAGRVFSNQMRPRSLLDIDSPEPVSMVVDGAFAERLGFATPQAAVGAIVYVPADVTALVGGTAAHPLEIIGVVETDRSRVTSTSPPATGNLFLFDPSSPWDSGLFPVVRIAGDDLERGLEAVTRTWNELAPAVAVDVQFSDDLFDQAFRQYARINQLFLLLSGVAFIIAAVGQLGIAVHVARRRRHEIGVRKTLGATTPGIVRLLIVDFSRPALVANLLAWPVAWLAAESYLQVFAHRIELTPIPFLFSLVMALAIAWTVALGEVLKAAHVHPAEVLRHA